VGGDLNATMYNQEKNGDLPKHQSMLDAFHHTLVDCALLDLGFTTHDHTWRNGWDGDASVDECLGVLMFSGLVFP